MIYVIVINDNDGEHSSMVVIILVILCRVNTHLLFYKRKSSSYIELYSGIDNNLVYGSLTLLFDEYCLPRQMDRNNYE